MVIRFAEELEKGKAGESIIANWLRKKGWGILPAYEKILDEYKGPRLYLPEGAFVAPDFLGFNIKKQKVLWIEAKHKTAFAWHRISKTWTTGIDLHHYESYLHIDEISPWPIWLLFLHDGGQAKDSPPNSPAGLFGNSLKYLRGHENHRHKNWGRHGMVYWSVNVLRKIADLDELRLS